jgi:hypothetical protein
LASIGGEYKVDSGGDNGRYQVFTGKEWRRGMVYLFGALAVYAVFIAALYAAQRSLLYHPDPLIPDPGDYGVAEMTAIRIETVDGYALLAWWRPPGGPENPVLVYFHGNAGHIGERADKIRDYLDAGFGVLLVSYRYNAGSGGKPGEAALFADGRAAMAYLSAQGVAGDRIVVYGESLGSGVAVAMAATHDVGAVVLEAPYSSMAELAQYHYWYAGARWLVRDRFDSMARIGAIDAPLLVVHGRLDRLIPPRFGQTLYNAATAPKEIELIDQAQHNDLLDYGLPKIVLRFIARYLGP